MDRDKLADKIRKLLGHTSAEICSKLKIDYVLFKNTCYKYNIEWNKTNNHARPIGAKDKKPRKSRKGSFKKGGNDLPVLVAEGDLKLPISNSKLSESLNPDSGLSKDNPFLVKSFDGENEKSNSILNTDEFISNIYSQINKPITKEECLGPVPM